MATINAGGMMDNDDTDLTGTPRPTPDERLLIPRREPGDDRAGADELLPTKQDAALIPDAPAQGEAHWMNEGTEAAMETNDEERRDR